jgi:KipI family sensor histidine kinase inhibitor
MTGHNQQNKQQLNTEVQVAEFMQHIRILPASESALIVYIDQPLSDVLAEQLKNITDEISLIATPHPFEIIASYASLLVNYDPLLTDHFLVKSVVRQAIKSMLIKSQQPQKSGFEKSKNQIVELPVYYSQQTGPDLQRIATHHNLTVEDIIRIHQQQTYRVFAIGFAPGFGYLGQVDTKISMPRLPTPRTAVPRGAVAIADRQTAVYPAISPGGWNIIGQCPILMFNPNNEPSMPFKVGDSVQFKAINQDRYLAMGGEL